MPGDRGIGCVRQSELLKAGLPPLRGHLVGTNNWKEAVEQHLIEVGPGQLGANRSADEPRPLAEQGDWMASSAGLAALQVVLNQAAASRLVPDDSYGMHMSRADVTREGLLDLSGQTVVCVLTGNGLKDPDRALALAPAVTPIPSTLTAVEAALGWS